MTTSSNNPPLGAGLRIASPLRLDHAYFEHESRPLLGSILLKKGWITPERLDAALAERGSTGLRLGEILLTRGWLFETELAYALAQQFELEYVDLAAVSVDPGAAVLIPLEVARRMFVVPVRFLGPRQLLVAVADPTDADPEALAQILKHEVTLAVGERSAIQGAWRHARQ
jgi:type IV pilus assembly protein PilB